MIRPELFKIIGNETRLRILLALAKEGEVTSYRIASVTFVSRKVVVKHVDMLERAGLVTVEKSPSHNGICRRCALNVENPAVKALMDFFRGIGLVSEAADFRVVALGRDGHMKTKLTIAPPITKHTPIQW